MKPLDDNQEKPPRSAALRNSKAVPPARECSEHELAQANQRLINSGDYAKALIRGTGAPRASFQKSQMP